MTIARQTEKPISGKDNGLRAIYAAASLALAAAFLASPAEAKVPSFSAACPGRVDVRANDGGPVFINGKPAKLKRFNDGYYQAQLGGVTISVTVPPRGVPNVSYAARGGAKGVCQVKAGRADAAASRPGRPGGNIPVGQMAAFCRGEASTRFRVQPSSVVTDKTFRNGTRYAVQGNFRDRGHTTAFKCWFDAKGKFLSVN